MKSIKYDNTIHFKYVFALTYKRGQVWVYEKESFSLLYLIYYDCPDNCWKRKQMCVEMRTTSSNLYNVRTLLLDLLR